MSFVGGVGQVTIKWESPERNPDPAATSYWLYATPVVSSRRRLLGEGKTAFAELKPTGGSGVLARAGGSGSVSTPFTAVVAIPGVVQSSCAVSQLDCAFPWRVCCDCGIVSASGWPQVPCHAACSRMTVHMWLPRPCQRGSCL